MVFAIDPELSKPKVIPGPYLTEVTKPLPKHKAKVSKQVVPNSSELPKTKFASGYCTDYVARKLPVTWGGNANRWITNAKAQGYLVDRNPIAGSILVTRESRIGHVAYIEKVEGTTITISEWNYAGRYRLTIRTLDISNPIISGIIHI